VLLSFKTGDIPAPIGFAERWDWGIQSTPLMKSGFMENHFRLHLAINIVNMFNCCSA
jgi:hypothetical protein